MSEYTQKGIELLEKMSAPGMVDSLKTMRGRPGADGALAEIAFDFCFGAVWARPGLTMAQRSAVVLGVVIAKGQTEGVKNHLHSALRNGLTYEEIDEILIQAIPYVGLPAVAAVARIWREVSEH